MVEFVLVAALLAVVFLGIVQVGIVLHIRNVLTANAAEGARFAASLGTDPSAGGSRSAELNSQTLSADVAGRVPCRGSARRAARRGGLRGTHPPVPCCIWAASACTCAGTR